MGDVWISYRLKQQNVLYGLKNSFKFDLLILYYIVLVVLAGSRLNVWIKKKGSPFVLPFLRELS